MTGRSTAIVGLLGLCGALALGGIGATGASFTDLANAGLGSGLGSPDPFDIAVVDGQGRVLQAGGPDGAEWAIPGADELLPGHAVTTAVTVFNNSPRLPAELELSIVPRTGGTQVSPSVPDITPHLRFTATLPDGTVLFEDVALAGATAALPALDRSDRAAQAEAAIHEPAATASSTAVTLTIDYLDEPGVESLNGGQSALALRFDATSRSGLAG